MSIIEKFSPLAQKIGASIHADASNREVTISLNGFTVRILDRPERMSGTYVTICKEADTEYALGHLIKYSENESDYKLDHGRLHTEQIDDLVYLTDKYAVPFLCGQRKDYTEFQTFDRAEVASLSANTKTYKANKWVRPEW
jgi:hypothetical protein